MHHQNYKNHVRYVPLWHFITGGALCALLIGSIVNLVHSARENLYSASLIVLISLILVVIFWYARWFALRAQDRAIVAEERLRYFILTGKPMSRHLRTKQIIALRFASDEELVELARRAVDERMRTDNIKKSIRHWRSDHHRV
jgi:hypothetical protein